MQAPPLKKRQGRGNRAGFKENGAYVCAPTARTPGPESFRVWVSPADGAVFRLALPAD